MEARGVSSVEGVDIGSGDLKGEVARGESLIIRET